MISGKKTKLVNDSKFGKILRNKSTKQNSLSSNTTISNTPKVINLDQKMQNKKYILHSPKTEPNILFYKTQSVRKVNSTTIYSKKHKLEKKTKYPLKKENKIPEQKIIKNICEKQNTINEKITIAKKINKITINLTNCNRENEDIHCRSINNFHRKTQAQSNSKILFENCLNYNDDNENFNVYFSNSNIFDMKEKLRKTDIYQTNNKNNIKTSLDNVDNHLQQNDLFYENICSKNKNKSLVKNLMDNINPYKTFNSNEKLKNKINIEENKLNETNFKNWKVNYDFDIIKKSNYNDRKIKEKLLEIIYNLEKKQKTISGKIRLNSNIFIEKRDEIFHPTKYFRIENAQNINNNKNIMRPFFLFWKKIRIINQSKPIKKLVLKKDKNIVIRTVIYRADKPKIRYNPKKNSNNNDNILKMEKIKKTYEKFQKSFVKIYNNLMKKHFNKLKQYYVYNKKKFFIGKLVSIFNNYYNTNNKLAFFNKLKEIKNNNYQKIQEIYNDLNTNNDSSDKIWTESAGKWIYQKNNKLINSMCHQKENEIEKQKNLFELDESSDSLYEIENENNQEILNDDKIIKLNTLLLNEVLNEDYSDQSKNDDQNNKENEIKNKKNEINENEMKENEIKNNEDEESKINKNEININIDYQKFSENYQNKNFKNENWIKEYSYVEKVEEKYNNQKKDDINELNHQSYKNYKNWKNENVRGENNNLEKIFNNDYYQIEKNNNSNEDEYIMLKRKY